MLPHRERGVTEWFEYENDDGEYEKAVASSQLM